MSSKTSIIKEAGWPEEKRQITEIRRSVFIQELGVPEERDFDGSDSACRHALAFLGDKAVGTGRIKPDGHIGRIAVLRSSRNQKVGSAILQFLMDMAERNGLEQVYLNSQRSAVGFYEKFGFSQVGDFFIDAGIDHVRMENTGFTNH